MYDLIEGVKLENSLPRKRKNYQIEPPSEDDEQTFRVHNETDKVLVEFTVLRWNDISSKYYKLGITKFWKRVLETYFNILGNVRIKEALGLP